MTLRQSSRKIVGGRDNNAVWSLVGAMDPLTTKVRTTTRARRPWRAAGRPGAG